MPILFSRVLLQNIVEQFRDIYYTQISEKHFFLNNKMKLAYVVQGMIGNWQP